MKRKSLFLLLAGSLCLPVITRAQGMSEKAMQQLRESNNTICYVNTKAPGVHKEYDSNYGGYVWRTGMGSFLCTDKNMRPLEDMDKNVYFTGVNNNPDDPEVEKTNLNNVQKVWDKDRGCYVWKDMFGNFLGRDKPSADKLKEWANKKDKNWMDKGSIPKKKLTPEDEKLHKELQDLAKKLEKEQEETIEDTHDKIREANEEAYLRNKKGEEGGNKYVDVDYSSVEILLNHMDGYVSSISSQLDYGWQKVVEWGYEAEYGGLVNNARHSVVSYRQRRNSVKDPIQMMKIADAWAAEMGKTVSLARQLMQKADHYSSYGSILSSIEQNLNAYRSERQRINY